MSNTQHRVHHLLETVVERQRPPQPGGDALSVVDVSPERISILRK